MLRIISQRNTFLRTLSSSTSKLEERITAVRGLADRYVDPIAFKAIVQAVDTEGLQAASLSAVETILMSCDAPRELTRYFTQLIDLVLTQSLDPDAQGYLLLRGAFKVLESTPVDTSDCVSVVMLYTPGRGFQTKSTDNRIGKLFIDFLNTSPDKLLSHNISRKSFSVYNTDQQLRGLLQPDNVEKGVLTEIIRQFGRESHETISPEVIAAHVRLLFQFKRKTTENSAVIDEVCKNLSKWAPGRNISPEDSISFIKQLNEWQEGQRDAPKEGSTNYVLTYNSLVVKGLVDAVTGRKGTIADKKLLLDILSELYLPRNGKYFNRIVDWINKTLDFPDKRMKLATGSLVKFLSGHAIGVDAYRQITEADAHRLSDSGLQTSSFEGRGQIHIAYGKKSIELLTKIACSKDVETEHRVSAVSAVIHTQPYGLLAIIDQMLQDANHEEIRECVYRCLGEIKYHKSVLLLLSRLEDTDYTSKESLALIQALLQIGTLTVLGNYSMGDQSVEATGLLKYVFDGENDAIRKMIETGLISLGFGGNVRYERRRREAVELEASIRSTRDAIIQKQKKQEGLIDKIEEGDFNIQSLRAESKFTRLSLLSTELSAQSNILDVHIRLAMEGEKLNLLAKKTNEKSQEVNKTRRNLQRETDRYDTIHKNLENLKSEVKALVNRLKKEEKSANTLKKRIDKNENKIRKAKEAISNLEKEEQTIFGKLEPARVAFNYNAERIRTVSSKLETIKQNATSSDQGKLGPLGKELKELSRKTSGLKTKLTSLKRRSNSIPEEITNEKQEIGEARVNIERANREVITAASRMTGLSNELKTLLYEIDAQQPNIEAAKREINRFRNTLNTQENSLEALLTKVRAVKAVIERLGKEEKKVSESYLKAQKNVASANKQRNKHITSSIANKEEYANRHSVLSQEIGDGSTNLETMGHRKEELTVLLAELGPSCSEQCAAADRRHRAETHDIWLEGFQKDLISHEVYVAINKVASKFKLKERKAMDSLTRDIYQQKTKA
jgi:uncharacterized coiled-coil DUF342 family protein